MPWRQCVLISVRNLSFYISVVSQHFMSYILYPFSCFLFFSQNTLCLHINSFFSTWAIFVLSVELEIGLWCCICLCVHGGEGFWRVVIFSGLFSTGAHKVQEGPRPSHRYVSWLMVYGYCMSRKRWEARMNITQFFLAESLWSVRI